MMNVAAVLTIISFVALQRNASIDLTRLFMSESESRYLAKPFETLIQQCMLLALLAGSVIFSLWNAEMIGNAAEDSKSQVYIVCECSIVICVVWLIAGGLVLRKAQQTIRRWREVEETATDVDYLRLKEQQYERLYYQVSRNPLLEMPMELIDEL